MPQGAFLSLAQGPPQLGAALPLGAKGNTHPTLPRTCGSSRAKPPSYIGEGKRGGSPPTTTTHLSRAGQTRVWQLGLERGGSVHLHPSRQDTGWGAEAKPLLPQLCDNPQAELARHWAGAAEYNPCPSRQLYEGGWRSNLRQEGIWVRSLKKQFNPGLS